MRLADLRIAMRDDVLVVSVSGEIDLSNVDELRMGVLDSLPNDALGVVLDLDGVDYLDSAAIHLLYDLHGRLGQRRQRLALAIPEASPVSDVMRIAAVPTVVTVHTDVDAAVGALRQ
jgi:anti-anti-sigma factor